MRTNMFTRLLMLALTLTLFLAGSAQADSCALCGKESGNDSYLCADCFLIMLEEKDLSGGLSIVGTTVNDNGSVTLVWDDAAANGPYNVYYELLERAPLPFGWTAAVGISENTVTFSQLVPGMSYVFTVEDAAGHKAEFVYYAPNVKLGNKVGAKLTVATRMRNGVDFLGAPFYVGDMHRPDAREHGLYVKLTYSMLKYSRAYDYSITVEAPNGFADVVYDGHVNLSYGRSDVNAWEFVNMENYFSYLERYYGGIPAGEYMVTLNFDGIPACEASFVVNK